MSQHQARGARPNNSNLSAYRVHGRVFTNIVLNIALNDDHTRLDVRDAFFNSQEQDQLHGRHQLRAGFWPGPRLYYGGNCRSSPKDYRKKDYAVESSIVGLAWSTQRELRVIV